MSASSDSASAAAVAYGIMQAISTKDTVLARTLLLSGANLSSIPETNVPTRTGRTQSDTQFLRSIASSPDVLLERIWDVSVWVHGSLAIVRAPYDFHVNNSFSHCGVDVLTMIKSNDAWRITHLVYTTQRTGCVPSPLGPPT